jgi:hypothetical protein
MDYINALPPSLETLPLTKPNSNPKPEGSAVPVTSVTGSRTYARNAAQQERARALFAKYGLTLEAHEWLTTGAANTNVQRVERPIRMRVHRSCHRCKTQFGADRVCVSCQHRRCQKCPRYPAKKDKTKAKETDATAKTAAAGVVAPVAVAARKKQHVMTTRDGRERTHTPIKQRVRRTCHRCNALFNPPTRTDCESCQHVRCVKCPRDPVKSKKYPNGYPGDAPASEDDETAKPKDYKRPERTWKKPRRRVRWTCENCSSLFREGTRTCQGCGHERGVEGCVCTREPYVPASRCYIDGLLTIYPGPRKPRKSMIPKWSRLSKNGWLLST